MYYDYIRIYCVCMCVCIYIYIYIKRERERERDRSWMGSAAKAGVEPGKLMFRTEPNR